MLIIIANVVLFLMTGAFTSEAVLATVATGYGVVPGELTNAQDGFYNPVPETAHAPDLHVPAWRLDAPHLQHAVSVGLADNVEDAFGHMAFLMLYLFVRHSRSTRSHGRHAGLTPTR